jgi:hypothetical protein
MTLSRFVALIGFVFAVGLALGGCRWATRPLRVCWTVVSQRTNDDTDATSTVSGRLNHEEVEAKFPWRMAALTQDGVPLPQFDSGEWAAREAKRRCGRLGLLLSVGVGGSYYASKWVTRREEKLASV